MLKELLKVSKNSKQNNSETVTNEHDKEVPKQRYISPEERQKIIESLKLIWWFKKEIWKIIINLLDNTANQTTKFRTKNLVEINDDAHRTSNSI